MPADENPGGGAGAGLAASAGDGRIPFTIRVGVTGHRALSTEAAVTEGTRAALACVRDLLPPSALTPVVHCAISSLAEGSDRLVAEVVLDQSGSTLEVPLPMAIDEYRTDFETEDSRAAFDRLLSRAAVVVEAPPCETRQEAYERAGRYVVDRCDVLVAVWDGEPSRGQGGTADVVAYALEQRVPVLVVPVSGGEVVEDLGIGEPGPAFRSLNVHRSALERERGEEVTLAIETTRASLEALDDYNSSRFEREAERVAMRESSGGDILDSEAIGSGSRRSAETRSLSELCRSVQPYFARADRRALAFQRLYNRFVTVIFIASALAVATAAYSALFAPDERWLAGVELFFLLLILVVVVAGRTWSVHRKWLSSRFLAERLRSSVFLKAAGLGARREGGFEGVHLRDPSEDWLRRAYTYVWNATPTVAVSAGQVEALREALIRDWIRPQITYHSRKSVDHERRQRLLGRVSIAAFGVTALVAIVHLSNVATGLEHSLLLLSIALPAFGSAFAGIAAQRQHQRNATVYRRMARHLTGAEARMGQAATVADVQLAAAAVDDITAEEHLDWLGVMAFNDFEIAG